MFYHLTGGVSPCPRRLRVVRPAPGRGGGACPMTTVCWDGGRRRLLPSGDQLLRGGVSVD